MYNPSREQVRQFFFDAWRRYRERVPLAGMDAIAVDVALLHPEYHPVLDDPARFLDRDYTPERGTANPFLHLSLHMAIEEQLSIDQPAGVRAAFAALEERCGDRHDALHETLECLGEMLWRAERSGSPPDAQGYLACVQRRGQR